MNTPRDRFPLRHMSIRVPWHDNDWNGTVCSVPGSNGACLKLPRIAEKWSDPDQEGREEAQAGRAITDLEQDAWPPCVVERATFMAPFSFTRMATHPYAQSSPKTHGHFAPTPLPHPPYSAPALPFLWMQKTEMARLAQQYGVDVDPAREPKLDTTWVQELSNQRPILDCFWEHIKVDKSLCFFYANACHLLRTMVGGSSSA
jgi:hypothetical protein